MNSSLHPTQQNCSEYNFQLSWLSSTHVEQVSVLLGELEEAVWHRGTRQHSPGRSSGCTRHPLHQGKCAQAVGHKAERSHEAHLSFVWERGSTVALFVALLHGCWVHPVNSTRDQIQHPPSPQSLPKPGPAYKPSPDPTLHPGHLLHHSCQEATACLFLVDHHFCQASTGSLSPSLENKDHPCWLEGSQGRTKKKEAALEAVWLPG